eukprot:335739-Chlamydomonas_euryale.AAC.2
MWVNGSSSHPPTHPLTYPPTRPPSTYPPTHPSTRPSRKHANHCHCRAVERRGGLDDYLLSTPDGALHSNAASTLRWQVLCELAKKREAEAAASVASRGSGNPEGRRAALRDLKPKA